MSDDPEGMKPTADHICKQKINFKPEKNIYCNVESTQIHTHTLSFYFFTQMLRILGYEVALSIHLVYNIINCTIIYIHSPLCFGRGMLVQSHYAIPSQVFKSVLKQ